MEDNYKKIDPAETEESMNKDLALDQNDLEDVTGGMKIVVIKTANCDHDWQFDHKEEGAIWGYNLVYKCSKCGLTTTEWE